MSANKAQTIVKKVKPYPFNAELDPNGTKKPIEVIYLTANGFIARLKANSMLKVGDYFQTAFQLPAMGTLVTAQVRVIKTYDRSVNPKAKLVERMAELHFEPLNEEQKKNILSFLNAIGQK